MAKDRERALKWVQRGDDWARLAEQTREDSVREACEKHAAWSYQMAQVWGGYEGIPV